MEQNKIIPIEDVLDVNHTKQNSVFAKISFCFYLEIEIETERIETERNRKKNSF